MNVKMNARTIAVSKSKVLVSERSLSKSKNIFLPPKIFLAYFPK